MTVREHRWADLVPRATSAAIAIPAVLAIAVCPWPAAWEGLVAVTIAVAAHESVTLLTGGRTVSSNVIAVLLALGAAAATYASAPLPGTLVLGLLPAAACGPILGAALRHRWTRWRPPLAATAAMFVTAGWCGVLPAHLALLRRDAGVAWLLLAFAVTWGGDIAAYLFGKAWGGARLAPRVSPGKTVAGAIAGLVAASLAGLVFLRAGPPGLDPASLMGATLVAGVLSQAGDLAESMLKRSSGARHSGRLIPGHGGMLDCIDGLCLVAPWLYYVAPLVAR